MITALSRTCESCGLLLPEPPAAAVCAACGRVAVPLHAEWPKGLKRWLVKKMLEQAWAPFHEFTEQYRWEWLLRSVIAGRQWRNRVVPRACYHSDCFVVAIAEFTAESQTATPLHADTRSSTHAA